MKNIFCLLLVMLLFGCKSENNNTDHGSEKVATPVKSAMVPNGSKVVAQPVKSMRDTVKPKFNRSNYSVSRARPKTEIQGTYPYDIDLKDATSKTVTLCYFYRLRKKLS